MTPQFTYSREILSYIKNGLNFEKKFRFSDAILNIHLETKGFIIYRFGLYRKKHLKPDFICFSGQKTARVIINILKLNNYESFSFPISITVLAFRLKPGNLKLVITGKFGLLFFSLNFGFSTFCPIFIRKKRE